MRVFISYTGKGTLRFSWMFVCMYVCIYINIHFTFIASHILIQNKYNEGKIQWKEEDDSKVAVT